MIQTYIQLVPLFFTFILGIFLRRIRFAEAEHGRFLLKFMFFITLPALVFLKISQIELDAQTLVLPLANIGVNLGCMLVTLSLAPVFNVQRQTLGAMLVCTMITNNAFMFPFMLAIYGDEGFAYAILFDFGNALITSTLTYALAFRYGPDAHTSRTLFTKTMKSPIVWALFAAVTVNLLVIPVPKVVEIVLEPLAGMTNPLILISLGILFTPRLNQLRLLSATLFIRMGVGMMLGVTVARLFGLDDLAFTIVVLCAAAPIGFNALTYSTLAGLDTEFTSSAVSSSILVGLFYLPLLMYLMTLF
ncbi:MAG: AEC family transporter [Gammaproteobacteria bacterium]